MSNPEAKAPEPVTVGKLPLVPPFTFLFSLFPVAFSLFPVSPLSHVPPPSLKKSAND